ncbi:MAG TPA: cupin-like domain-containing protein [Planctomycetota bacterium]|nr:cupin-like domain-containing protein [Planctomycetota bacterium]
MAQYASDVERVHRPPLERFVEDYLRPQRPVVLTGAIDDWPALTRWDQDYLRRSVGDRRLRVEAVAGSEKPGYFGRRSLPQTMAFGDYLTAVVADQRVPRLYLGGISIPGSLPELAVDVRLPEYVLGPNEPVPYFWLGAGHSTTQLHYDINNNFHALIRGRKTFVLFAPDQSRDLYPTSVFSPRRHFSRVKLEDPDDQAFPRLRRATGCQATLERGEMLFLPSLWWHEVRTEQPSIGVNYWWGLNRYGSAFAWLYLRELPLIWWTLSRAQLRWRIQRLTGGRA